MILLNICVSDIPKEKIFNAKSGKKYLNVTVDRRKGTENEYTVFIYDKETKEKTYIGRGKELVFEKKEERVLVDESADVNDVPF
jgi:hypothetical protein